MTVSGVVAGRDAARASEARRPAAPQPGDETIGPVQMQANLDVVGPEMATGDPVPAFWFAS